MFVNLRVFSHHSFLLSALKVEDIVNLAKKYKMPAIAISDYSSLGSLLEFSNLSFSSGIKPIMACSINIVGNDGFDDVGINAAFYAKNQNGLKNLMQLNYLAFQNSPNNPHLRVCDLKFWCDDLIILAGAYDEIVAKYDKKSLLFFAKFFHEIASDRFYLEVQRYSKKRLCEFEDLILDIADTKNIPIVATNSTYFSTKEKKRAHDVLLCIKNGEYINGTRTSYSNDDFRFKSHEEMKLLFADLNVAIENSEIISKRCSSYFEERSPILPRFSSQEDEFSILAKSAREGLKSRIVECTLFDKNYFSKNSISSYYERLEYELSIFNTVQFSGYLLIVSDFIKFARSNYIPVGPGRGSGAGSIVSWSLQITDIDPILFGLFFERFLNPDRISMPDLDIDFCPERRQDVIKYVISKYGDNSVAHIATVGTLQPRAVIRDVGRVLGFPYMHIDKISKMIPNNPANPITLSQAIAMDQNLSNKIKEDDETKELIDIALSLEGLFRHSSVHAAGIVISADPIINNVPIYRDQFEILPITQFDMKNVERSGLIKFDFLGLKTLTLINNTIAFASERLGRPIKIDNNDFSNKAAFELLSSGLNMGIFQLESKAMQGALRLLKPNHINDIVALISLNRPGPIDNLPAYIDRKHGIKSIEYIHEDLKEILEETFGIIIYQEQVMKVAEIIAGYSLGEADLLRRAMGKKIRSEMDGQKDIFIARAVALGRDRKISEEIFNTIEKFAGYGFNKSHAAAYGVISYRTALLKALYPSEFFVSCLNAEINNTDKIFLFIKEIEKYNIKIVPPCINNSDVLFSISENNEIVYSLAACKGIGLKSSESIVKIRESLKDKRFASIEDLLKKCSTMNLVSEKNDGKLKKSILNKKILERLICSGALSSIYPNAEILIKNIDLLLSYIKSIENTANSSQLSLHSDSNALYIDEMPTRPISRAEKCKWELQSFGFHLRQHPLCEYQEEYYAKHNFKKIAYIKEMGEGTFQFLALVDNKKNGFTNGNKFTQFLFSDPSDTIELRHYAFDGNSSNSKLRRRKDRLEREGLNSSSLMIEEGDLCSVCIKVVIKDDKKRIQIQSLNKIIDNDNDDITNIKIRISLDKLHLLNFKSFLKKYSSERGDINFVVDFVCFDNKIDQFKLSARSSKLRLFQDENFMKELSSIDGIEVLDYFPMQN